MGFVGQIMIKLKTSFIGGFLKLPLWCSFGSNLCKHAGCHSTTTEVCTSLVWYGGLEAHWNYNNDDNDDNKGDNNDNDRDNDSYSDNDNNNNTNNYNDNNNNNHKDNNNTENRNMWNAYK